MQTNTFEWQKTPQLSIFQFLLATFIPSGIGLIGFHFVLPAMVKNGTPVLIAWPAIASVMLFGFVVVAIYMLRREAKTMGISLWTRMCLKPLSLKEWGIYLGIAVVGLAAISGIQTLIPGMLKAIGYTIPAYMPFFLNPAIDATTASMDVVSPGLPLQGAYPVLLLFVVALLLNILTEELYFRAWMLPKLSHYGNRSWVINGLLFALYHVFQLWLFPVLLVSSLLFAFIFYRTKSIWLPMTAHLIGNFLLSILGILFLIAS
ncbi:MAG: CPBP family intramembrane metalloprotease [Anaerolineaceae bacterium]|nr:CPBP family intramembrane metalloprotease [Anaerolineaceae bacterium]